MAATGATQYVDLQDQKQEITVTEYLSEDLKKNWSRVWTTGAFNSENVYYETEVYTAAKKHLWYTGWVTLCGYPGDGKTCTAEHLVCNFVRGPWQYPQKRESWSSLEPRNDVWERKRYYSNAISETNRPSYTPVFISNPAEYHKQLNSKEYQIFVIDDIFGEACLNLSRVEQWRPHLEDIMVDVTANRPKTLVIVCVNKEGNDLLLRAVNILQWEKTRIDKNSELQAHLERVPDEILRMEWFKRGLMMDFTSTHALEKADQKDVIVKNAFSGFTRMDQYAMQDAGFFHVKESAGLVYRIYSQISTFKMEGAGFFRDPWRHIQETIDKIYRFDKIFYYTIGVATLLDGQLDLSKYSVGEYDPRSQSVFQELIPLLNIPEHVNLSKMRFAAKQLTGFFFQPTDQWHWTFSHPKIYYLCIKSLYSRCNKHVAQLASPKLIQNYIRTMGCLESRHELVVKVARESYESLARKYLHQMISGQMKQVIQNSCFDDADFVKCWFEQMSELGNQETVMGLRDSILNRSLFYWACFYGHGHMVQVLLQSDQVKCRSEVWFQQEMIQGLYAACASNSPTSEIAVMCLLDYVNNLNVCEIYEENTYGKVFGRDLCYLMFLGAPLLHVAAKLGHPDCVKLLLEKGASLTDETKDKVTALHRAATRLDSNAEGVVEVLIKKGANINQGTPTGRLPIHEAITSGNKRVVAALEKAGSNIHGTMEDGRAFLTVAIQGQQKELVDYLLMKGVNANGNPVQDSFTPLQHAINTGDTDLIDRLIENKGANVNKMSKAGMGALHLAVLCGEEEIIETLIAKGADVNLKGTENKTPLHIAAKHGLYNICDILLKAGAKPEMMTASRKTALVLAAEGNHQTVVWLLLKEGMELEGGGRDIGGPFMGRDFYRMFHH